MFGCGAAVGRQAGLMGGVKGGGGAGAATERRRSSRSCFSSYSSKWRRRNKNGLSQLQEQGQLNQYLLRHKQCKEKTKVVALSSQHKQIISIC